jgi:hypothetical protein
MTALAWIANSGCKVLDTMDLQESFGDAPQPKLEIFGAGLGYLWAGEVQ